MNNKLQLLAGLPIFTEGVGNLYPLTLKDIATIGENVYNTILSYLIFEKEDLQDKDLYEDNIDCFDIITRNSILDARYRQMILTGLSLFFREEAQFYFDENNKFFYLGKFTDGKYIQKINFNQIKEIIKYQNCIKAFRDEEEFNPSSEKARQLIEKLKKNRQKLKKLKKDEDGEPLTLYDLVSILSANGNGINIMNVWDLTMVQFNDQFNRMKMLEDYDINIRSLLAGAKSDEVNMKHWMRKIKDDE